MTSNHISHFAIFIGIWNTRGEVLETEQAPATTLVATDSYRWLPGHHFLVHDVDARFGTDVSRSMEIIGYDTTNTKYVAHSYDDKGVSEVFDVVLNGKHWKILGETVRFEGEFSSDDKKLVGLWELKSKKSVWQPWIKLELIRAEP